MCLKEGPKSLKRSKLCLETYLSPEGILGIGIQSRDIHIQNPHLSYGISIQNIPGGEVGLTLSKRQGCVQGENLESSPGREAPQAISAGLGRGSLLPTDRFLLL